jgi:phosphomevalonate kinase
VLIFRLLLQCGSHSLLSVLAPENQAWDLTVTPFALPPRTRLLLADIHAGSNTPLLVSKVLKWRAENCTVGENQYSAFGRTCPCLPRISSVAHSLWTALDQCNTSLGQTLARLTELHEKDEYAYVETVRWAAGLQPMQVRPQFLTSTCHLPSRRVIDLPREAIVARKP